MLPKNKAIEKIREQIDEINEIRSRPRFSPEFKKWCRDTEVAIERSFGQDTRHLKDFTSIRFGLFMYSDSTPDYEFDQAFQKGLTEAAKILESFVEEIEEYVEDDSTLVENNSLSRIEDICERFHLVARQLRSRHDDRSTLSIEDEYDVQDLMHALLTLEFQDIRPEEWTPSYAGGAARMDFLLKQERIVLETKKTRNKLGARELGEQLIVDIHKYRQHPHCEALVCLVYDPEGRIANPRGIENDLNRQHEGMVVKVIIAPKGT